MDIKILTCEDTPWWQYLQLDAFFMFDHDVDLEDVFLIKMYSFKSDPWLQREGDRLESFDDASSSFILALLGWVYFKMLWFDDFFNSSGVRVFWGLLPFDDDLNGDPKNALIVELLFDCSKVLTLPYSFWLQKCF